MDCGRTRNKIRIEREDGSVTDNREEIGNMALHHFKHHLNAFSVVPPANAFDHIESCISEDVNHEQLTCHPDMDEILNIIISMNLSSAPGPDGCTGGQAHRHWVNWADVCRDKCAGGLGIKSLEDIRKGLQHKLAWRCMEPSSLWGRFVLSTYKEGHPGSHTWTYISKVLPSLRNQSTWDIGRGEISVRDFCWLYQISSPTTVTNLPLHVALANPKSCHVLHNILPPHGQDVLQNITISDHADAFLWSRSPSNTFSTKDFRVITSTPQAHDSVLAQIWHAWLPPKVSAFIWQLKKRVVPTDDRVQGCGIPLASMMQPHQVALQVWSLGKRHLDIPIPRTFSQLWALFTIKPRGRLNLMDGLRIAWSCCSLWEVWRYRNICIHEGTHYNVSSKILQWMHTLAPLIQLLYTPSVLNSASLKALRIPIPYAPKARWKTWTPFSNGTTLNVAWVMEGAGLKGAFILRDERGCALHCSTSYHIHTHSGLAQALRDIQDVGLKIDVIQSCHSDIPALKAKLCSSTNAVSDFVHDCTKYNYSVHMQ
ncbi:hypothetical protein QQ045_017994 [Rhodiola kirilowii]